MCTKVGNPKECCPNKKTEEKEEEQKITKHWIKFNIKDNNGTSVPDVIVQITLPDGSVVEKSSDENGLIEVKNIDPGECTIDSDWKDYEVNDTVLIQ